MNNLSLLPSVHKIINLQEVKKLEAIYPYTIILDTVREVIDSKRNLILQNKEVDISLETILNEIKYLLPIKDSYSLKKIINATGIIIHTNLGRVPLAKEVIQNLINIASNYSNLEVDITTGKRTKRHYHLNRIMKKLTGNPNCLIVNNNAAAVLLIINTLAKDREVIISRGELIEIGGEFRLPDIIKQGGAKLVEVGTTNRTYLKDYENAINENTALILKCHTSNYKILGYHNEVDNKELIELGKRYNLPVTIDLGSGLLIDLQQFNLPYEPTILDNLKYNFDLVTFSGDKLLGGPQCGFILGKKELIERLEKNPLLRALRVDKLCIAALESTLKLYLEHNKAINNLPVFRYIKLSSKQILNRAKSLVKNLKDKVKNLEISIKPENSEIGGGALPLLQLPTYVIAIKSNKFSAEEIGYKLRQNIPPIIGRIKENHFLIDLRTCEKEQEKEIFNALINLDVNI